MLKGAIFSLHDVLAKQGDLDAALLAETFRLLRYLKKRGVEPVFVSNKQWTVTYRDTGVTKSFKEVLETELGPVGYYIGGIDGMPYKPQAAATDFILQKQGWNRREVVFIGNSDIDMKTASTGRLMFLNATWHGKANPYGFQFSSPLDIARFLDCLCLGLNDWFWTINDGPLRVYAMAPFSTLSSQYLQAHAYSANARATSKQGMGDSTFWGRLLAARVYFSGLVDEDRLHHRLSRTCSRLRADRDRRRAEHPWRIVAQILPSRPADPARKGPEVADRADRGQERRCRQPADDDFAERQPAARHDGEHL